MSQFVVGLTGGIGSGKTTVAALFAKKGIVLIDTDQLARDVIQPGSKALQDIVQAFGPSVLSSDHTLNRRALRKIIFADLKKRQWLEHLLHPLIRIAMLEKIQAAQSPYCIAIIPLLLENEPNPIINRILVVDASESLQKIRAIKRDELHADDIQKIIDSQIPREKRLQGAQDVIVNDGKLEDLIPQVDKLHELYFTLSQKLPRSRQ